MTAEAPSKLLTQAELLTRLDALKTQFLRGMQGFREAGEALYAIKFEGLWKINYTKFWEFCRAELEISQQNADLLISASGAMKALDSDVNGKAVSSKLTDVRAAAALNTVPLEQRAEVTRRLASLNTALTPMTVKTIVKRVATETSITSRPIERSGLPEVQAPFAELAIMLRDAKIKMAEIAGLPTGRWLRQDPENADSALSTRLTEPLARLGETLRAAAPVKSCPRCTVPNWQCTLCFGAGWVAEAVIKATPR